MSSINIKCPHCERDITIVEEMQSANLHVMNINNVDGNMGMYSYWNVCPNPDCNKTILDVRVCKIRWSEPLNNYQIVERDPVVQRRLIPKSAARTFPDYVPAAIREDYEEACAIVPDSPKAAATLARRAIQGIVRDYWEVKPGNLANEIDQLKDDIEPDTWGAIDAVRSVGNVGAHMEKDIDVIVTVDAGEADLLIELIETLVDDCYIARHKRQSRLAGIIQLGETKKAEREQARQAKRDEGAEAKPADNGE